MADKLNESFSRISWSKVHEIATKSTIKHFFESLRVWIDKPHVVNRRLSGSLPIKNAFLSRMCCKELIGFVMSESSIGSCDVCTKVDGYPNNDDAVGKNNSVDESSSVEIVLRRLLPRLMAKNDRLVELVLVGNRFFFIVVVCSQFEEITIANFYHWSVLFFSDRINNEVLFIPVCTEKPKKQDSNDDQKNNYTEMMPYKISYIQYNDTDMRYNV